MADALSDITAMIERVRAEADAAGYARAWAEMLELARSHQGAGSTAVKASDAGRPMAETRETSRAPRGENRERVKESLRTSDKPRAAQELRRHVETRDGIELAYSSVQQALMQLEAAEEAVKDADGKWSRPDAPWLQAGVGDPYKFLTEEGRP